MLPNSQSPVDWDTLTEEILNGKLFKGPYPIFPANISVS